MEHGSSFDARIQCVFSHLFHILTVQKCHDQELRGEYESQFRPLARVQHPIVMHSNASRMAGC